MFHSGPVKEEFSQSTYQSLPYWKSWGSKNKSIRYEALVEEVHETSSTEFIKDQTLVLVRINDSKNNLSRSNNLCNVMKHESCQNSVKSMKHCALPPHPPLQINRKVRRGSKENHTQDLIEASEKMKTPDDNILEI